MNFYKRQRRTPTVIIVSLIDIFAILLIFVIVTTTFKRAQPAVTIKLPESSSASSEAPESGAEPALLTISPGPKAEVYLDNKRVSLEELPEELKAVVASHRPLALNADTAAPFGIVVRVMDALKAAGVKGNLPAFTETIQQEKEH